MNELQQQLTSSELFKECNPFFDTLMKIARFFEIAEVQTNVAVLKRRNKKALNEHSHESYIGCVEKNFTHLTGCEIMRPIFKTETIIIPNDIRNVESAALFKKQVRNYVLGQ